MIMFVLGYLQMDIGLHRYPLRQAKLICTQTKPMRIAPPFSEKTLCLARKESIRFHTPHDFRRGHANFLFDRAQDIGDLDAARENLMHDSLTTTEMYARKRKAQVKSRIQNMSNQRNAVIPGVQGINVKIDRIESQLSQLALIVKERL